MNLSNSKQSASQERNQRGPSSAQRSLLDFMKANQFRKLREIWALIDPKLNEQLAGLFLLEFKRRLRIFLEVADRGKYHQVQEHGSCLLHVQNLLIMVILTSYGHNDY